MARAVDVLIFSRDRAAQLDLLLRSIRLHARELYRTLIVLYRPTTMLHTFGYMHARRLWMGGGLTLAWWREEGREGGFERDVRYWLENDDRADAVSFLVDDDVFYRPAPAPERLPWSYRGGDHWYPFSVDGNVYERRHLLRLLRDVPPFRNPSELEAFGHEARAALPFAEVYPCVPPCLVGVPANRVSESSGMPHLGVDPVMLNERFLRGDRLALPIVDEDLPAHAPLELTFA